MALTPEQLAALEAEGNLYRLVQSKIRDLIQLHERMTSGELNQIAVDVGIPLDQVQMAYMNKLATEKGAIIQELLGIYQQYVGG